MVKVRIWRCAQRGFTLIELLVVVAIIALLISILLPSLASAKERARTVACQANLKGIGFATNMYVDDQGGYVVPAHALPNGAPGDQYDWGSPAASLVQNGYAKAPNQKANNSPGSNGNSIFRCPSGQNFDARAALGTTFRAQSNVDPVLYGFWRTTSINQEWVVDTWYGTNGSNHGKTTNGNGRSAGLPTTRTPDATSGGWKDLRKLADLPMPREIVYMYDGYLYAVTPQTNGTVNWVHARHTKNTTLNVLFYDWHVENLPVKAIPASYGMNDLVAAEKYAKWSVWQYDQAKRTSPLF